LLSAALLSGSAVAQWAGKPTAFQHLRGVLSPSSSSDWSTPAGGNGNGTHIFLLDSGMNPAIFGSSVTNLFTLTNQFTGFSDYHYKWDDEWVAHGNIGGTILKHPCNPSNNTYSGGATLYNAKVMFGNAYYNPIGIKAGDTYADQVRLALHAAVVSITNNFQYANAQAAGKIAIAALPMASGLYGQLDCLAQIMVDKYKFHVVTGVPNFGNNKLGSPARAFRGLVVASVNLTGANPSILNTWTNSDVDLFVPSAQRWDGKDYTGNSIAVWWTASVLSRTLSLYANQAMRWDALRAVDYLRGTSVDLYGNGKRILSATNTAEDSSKWRINTNGVWKVNGVLGSSSDYCTSINASWNNPTFTLANFTSSTFHLNFGGIDTNCTIDCAGSPPTGGDW
jgi:hypothetical protein